MPPPLESIRKHIFAMSQVQFADALKVNQSTVSRWENGVLEPSRDEMRVIRELAIVLGKRWDDRWFFDGAPEPAMARTGSDG